MGRATASAVAWFCLCHAFAIAIEVGAQTVLYDVVSPGASRADEFGSALSCIGDIDGDEVMDFVVGAPQQSGDTGFAAVYSGDTGALIEMLVGTTVGGRFGNAVAGAGLVNDDGVPDIVIAAQGGATPPGEVFVFSGSDLALIHTLVQTSGQQFGFAVDGAGDVNADGRDDVIVAHVSGSADIFSGLDGELIHNLGTSSAVSGLGDVNGDGFADVIVGDGPHGLLNTGTARVVSGQDGSVLFEWFGSVENEFLGRSVDVAGDVNGDGVADAIVGSNSGTVRVFSGLDGLLLQAVVSPPLPSGASFGHTVSGAGDINGDGVSDYLVGAPTIPDQHGSAFVVSGKEGVIVTTIAGSSEEWALGEALSAAGDVNQDGYSDVLVGSVNSARIYSVTPWKDIGSGLGGGGDAPLLTGGGSLLPDSEVAITMSGGRNSSPATLYAGLTILGAPFKGGTLIPTPDIAISGISTSIAGGLTLTARWPTSLRPGTTVFLQVWIVDEAGPFGFTASNALAATTP